MQPISPNRSLLVRMLGPTGGWKRQAATLGTALAVAGGLALAEGKPGTVGLKAQAIGVTARPIAVFDKEHPEKKIFGRLVWRGGLVLTSPTSNFGGWSGLAMDPSGRRFIAVSDGGTWLTADLAYEGIKPAGLKFARMGPLQSTGKKTLARQRDRDAEGIVLLDGTPDKGTALVSFEQNDRIGRFALDSSGLSAPTDYLALPPEMKKVRSNDGFEAITMLRGGPMKGATVAFTEHLLGTDTTHAGWIWIGGLPKRISLTDMGGFDITDAASLEDGSLIVLERRFRWNEGVKMRLRQIKASELKPGAVLAGEVLIEADLNQEIDNMEGLGIHTTASGETILTLISDDNFNTLLQRSILLQFALAPENARESAATAVSKKPVP